MVSGEIYRFFVVTWILSNLILILPIYMTRLYWQFNKKILTTLSIILGNIGVGFLILIFVENLRATEIQLVLFGTSLFVAWFVIPRVLQISKIIHREKFKFRVDMVGKILESSLSEFNAKIIKQQDPVTLQALLKPSMWFEYFLEIQGDNDNPEQLKFTLKPVGSSETYFRLLYLVAIYPIVMALVVNNFSIPFIIINNSIDAEILLVLTIFVLIGYLVINNKNLQEFFPEFNALKKSKMKDLVQDIISQKNKDEDSEQQADKTGKSIDFSKAKEKAQEIKEMRFKENLERKQQELRERVEGIFGTEIVEEKGLEPELIRKQALIKKISTILVSTPIGKKITLKEIMNKVEEENDKKVEQIIIGLISKNEIQGEYNIWDRTYVRGDINSRFIERTLENLDINEENLDYIKLNLSGDVEIKFLSNGKDIKLGKTVDEKNIDENSTSVQK